MLTGQGLLVILAGSLEAKTGLPPVEVNVLAVEEATSAAFNPEELSFEAEGGETYFISPEEIRIGTANITEAEAGSLLAEVDKWNSSHGFYPAEEGAGQVAGGDAAASKLTGNLAYTWFRLSTKPEEGENIVLNFSFDKGDKSIALARSYRFRI